MDVGGKSMSTAQEVFASAVRSLPPAERLRLAALIINELAQSGSLPLNAGTEWSGEDTRDLMAFSLKHAEATYPADKDLV